MVQVKSLTTRQINIVPGATPDAPAQFVPVDLTNPNTTAKDPLRAEADEIVHWHNITGEIHQPWPTDEKGNPLPDPEVPRGSKFYLSDPIQPNAPSRPGWTAVSGSNPRGEIHYCCKRHPKEKGMIIVAPPETS